MGPCTAYKGHTECMELLIKSGASVNKKDRDGMNALIWASQNGHISCITLLLDAGADVNQCIPSDGVAASFAARRDHSDCLNLLVNSGAGVNISTIDGWTPLMEASCKGYNTCVRLLLDSGADVNIVDSYGYTALAYAASGIDIKTTVLLLKAGTSVKNLNILQFSDGYTRGIKTYELLEAAGADVKPQGYRKPEINLKTLCINFIRHHLLTCNSDTNLFCTVPQLGLPSQLERILLFNVSLDENPEK